MTPAAGAVEQGVEDQRVVLKLHVAMMATLAIGTVDLGDRQRASDWPAR